mgnify:CR=1 FL=1
MFLQLLAQNAAELFHFRLFGFERLVFLVEHCFAVFVGHHVVWKSGSYWKGHFGSNLAEIADSTVVFHEAFVIEVIHVSDFATGYCAASFEKVVVANPHFFHDWSTLWVLASYLVNDSCLFLNDVVFSEGDGATSCVDEGSWVHYATVTKVDISLNFR